MERITPKQVIAAYRKTGLKPATGSFLREKSACAMGVFIAYKLKTFHHPDIVAEAHRLLNASDYYEGFIDGFDGRAPLSRAPLSANCDPRKLFKEPDEYWLGLCDGIDAHIAVAKVMKIQ